MIWERETSSSSDEDRLSDRFTETPRARQARLARKRVDAMTARAIRTLLTPQEATTTMSTKKKNPWAVKLGRLGGRVKSPAKTRAVRLNGKKGGRPRKASA